MKHCPQQGTPDILQCPYCGCTKHLLIDKRVKSIDCMDCDYSWLPMPFTVDWRLKEKITKDMAKLFKRYNK